MPATAMPLLDSAFTAAFPIGVPLRSSAVPGPSPAPDLSEVSGATQAAAHLLGQAFVRDLLAAPNHEGQMSTTRNRYGGGGKYAPGLAIRWLRSEGLISPVGFAASVSFKGKGHIERIWRLLDPATAQAWLAAQES